MHLSLLKAFVSVATHGSVSRASEELYLTQPAVTKQIKALEQIYDKALFERNRKRLILTEEGKILFDYANRILALVDESQISVRGRGEGVVGKLKIASNYTLGVYLLPKIIKFFRDVYPQVQVEMFLGNTERIIRAIKRHETHFGFIGAHLDETSIATHSFYQDRLLIIIGPDHALKKSSVRWRELLDVPFVGREKGSDIRDSYESWFHQKGIKITPAIELNSTEAIKSAVQAGLGFSILPWCAVEQEARIGLLRTLSAPYFHLTQEFYICHYRDRAFSKVEKVFLEAIFNRLSVGPPRVPEAFEGLFLKG